MLPWQTPHNRVPVQTLPFFLVLGLAFFIEVETTIVRFGYVLALNEKRAVQALFALTIILPCLVWATCVPPRPRLTPSWLLIRLGLSLWLTGAAISTLDHRDNPYVVLDFFAGICSAAAVFYAVRRFRFTRMRQLEAAFSAVALGALIPAIEGIVAYYRMWGIPNAQMLPINHYKTLIWGEIAPFGNPDHVGTMYCILAAPCLGILFPGAFSKKTRWLAWALLIAAGLNVILSFARASLVAFALTVACATFFSRRKKSRLVAGAAVAFLAVLVMAQPSSLSARRFVQSAVEFDAMDPSVRGRLTAMHDSWNVFLQYPLTGVGAAQSPRYIGEGWTAHQLAIWQATEYGAVALAGVVLVTAGCLGRLISLLRAGCRDESLRLEFVFLLGPAIYFCKGLVADVNTNATVVNTWICTVFLMLAIADSLSSGAAANARLPVPCPWRWTSNARRPIPSNARRPIPS